MSTLTSTVRATPSTILQLFSSVQLHAARERDRVPKLATVHAFIAGGQLVTEATDRYRIARAALPYSETSTVETSAVVIPVSTVANMVRAVKPLVKTYDLVTLDWVVPLDEPGTRDEPSRVTLRVGDTVVFGEQFDTMLPDEYPKIGQIISKTVDFEPGDPSTEFAVNPEYLTEFWKGIKQGVPNARDRNGQPLRFHSAREGGPVMVAWRDWFVGAIMPVRLYDDERNIPPRWIADMAPDHVTPNV